MAAKKTPADRLRDRLNELSATIPEDLRLPSLAGETFRGRHLHRRDLSDCPVAQERRRCAVAQHTREENMPPGTVLLWFLIGLALSLAIGSVVGGVALCLACKVVDASEPELGKAVGLNFLAICRPA